jgi:tRNA dimethylallyltransferase
MTPKVAAIVGPTAVGKTSLSIEVAESLGAEIVSIDSMQTYVGMDAGTAKPSVSMRERVPHHMIDVFDPSVDVTVAEFQAAARDSIEAISSRGQLPLLVGGSGLYFRAVVDDLRFPPRSEKIRRALERKADDLGAEALHARLAELDPTAAQKIDPSNARRTVRALEVIELTGRPFSENDSWERYDSVYDLAVAGLTRARDDLSRRIDQRAARMVTSGLIEEARLLDARGMSRTARQALGYGQVLEAGVDAVSEEVADGIARATRRFARRQLSWWRSDPRVVWFDAAEPGLGAALVAHFRRALRLP